LRSAGGASRALLLVFRAASGVALDPSLSKKDLISLP
jgi:hypothetical protein